MDFRNKRVLITGSSGFVGTALCKKLEWYGAIVTPYDIKQGLDVLDLRQLEYVCTTSGIEIIFHLAAQSQVLVANDYPSLVIDTNIIGTANILEVTRRSKTIKRLIVASTDKVYGDVEDRVNEAAPFLAKNPYDVSKACADMLCQLYAQFYGLDVVISRSCNIYGAGDMNYTRLIPKTIYGVIADTAPEVYGDGNQTREWIYIDDVVYGYLALADVPAGAYNFGGDEMTVNGVIQIIRSFTGCKESVHIGEGKAEIYSQHIDDTKMREFGWERKTNFTDGIRQTIDGIYEKEMKRAYR